MRAKIVNGYGDVIFDGELKSRLFVGDRFVMRTPGSEELSEKYRVTGVTYIVDPSGLCEDYCIVDVVYTGNTSTDKHID